MIVYGSNLSPYVRKVLVVAAEKGVEVENRVAGPGVPPTADFSEASPFGKIPALRDGDFLLADSTAIAFYLEAKHPEPNLIPTEAKARARCVWFDEFADTVATPPKLKVFFNRVVAKLIGRQGDEAVAAGAERVPAGVRLSGAHDPGGRLPRGGPLHPGRHRRRQPLREPVPRPLSAGRPALPAHGGLSGTHPRAPVLRLADRA